MARKNSCHFMIVSVGRIGATEGHAGHLEILFGSAVNIGSMFRNALRSVRRLNICRIEKVDDGVERGIDEGRRSRGIRSPTELLHPIPTSDTLRNPSLRIR